MDAMARANSRQNSTIWSHYAIDGAGIVKIKSKARVGRHYALVAVGVISPICH